MAVNKASFNLNEELVSLLGNTSEEAEYQAAQRLVLSLIQDSQITASRGAELLDVSYDEMLQIMQEHSVSLVRTTANDVDQDVDTLDKFIRS